MAFAAALPAAAQTNDNITANTNQATPPASPTPIPVSAVVAEAETATARARAIRSTLTSVADVTAIEAELPALREQVNEADITSAEMIKSPTTLEDIRTAEQQWQAFSRRLAGWRATLGARITALDKDIAELGTLSERWKETLAALTSPSPAEEGVGEPVPPEVIQRANEVMATLADVRQQAGERRSVLISLQSRASELESRVDERRQELSAAREQTLTNLFQRDAAPIWMIGEEINQPADLFFGALASFNDQVEEVRTYVLARVDRFALHGLVLILLTSALYWARSLVRPRVKEEPKLETAAQIFELPFVTALILSVVLSRWFYPEAPRLLSAVIWAAALLPVVILLRRLVERPLFIFLNILVVLFFIDRLREILAGQQISARVVFLAEMLGAIFFLVWFLRSTKVAERVEARHYRIFELVRKVIPFALVIFAIAFLANALGYVSLANLIGNGVLGSAYAALVAYTAVLIVSSLILFALRVRPLSGLGLVKNNRPVVRDTVTKIVRWAAFIIWALITLNLFSIRETIFEYARAVLAWGFSYGSFTITVGDVVLFIITIWVAVMVSRLIRFVLEEDIYPRVEIGGGVSYAVSTMLHYTIIVLGFLLAVAALGVDFSNFAIIAGAVGIGIGFGLQNIINNFVSGLILLFERPVKVGDTIQLGEHMGSLKQIGLRASVLRTVGGSDVIVPNSQLISDEVINWTMYDKQRRIDIPVGVAYGTDADQVLAILTGVTTGVHDILDDPAPRALFLAFGDNSLDFELRLWTDNTDRWVALRSEMMVAVNNALNEAGIEIPFPQRDLHLRSIDPDAAKNIAGTADES
ncbi:MAG: mechanosensitive ion channel [Blastocatellia bacterium]|nr:mechanosensitive ion channel [Blastocatellia bacterium]